MGSPGAPPPGSQPASPHPQMQPNGGGGALVDPVGVMPTGPAVLAAEVQAGQYTATWQPTSPTTHLETLALVEQNR